MKGLLLRVLLGVCAWSVAAASAEDASKDHAPARLTDRGRIMVGGTIAGGWSNDDRHWGAYNRWWVGIHPAVTYFVRDRVGIGAWAGGGTGRGNLSRVNQASVGLEGLFDVKLSPRVSWFVRPYAGFLYESRTEFRQYVLFNAGSSVAPADLKFKRQYVRLGTDLPLVFHVSESVAIGLGPEVTLDVFVKEDSNLDALTGATVASPRSWRAVTGVSSFVGASF